MSVTLHLYRPNFDVDYLGSKYEFITKEDRKEVDDIMCGNDVIAQEDEERWEDMFADRYSDGEVQTSDYRFNNPNHHSIIDITWFYMLGRCSTHNKAAFRYARKLEEFGYKIFAPKFGNTIKYITVDTIVYRQGWFLNKKFFNKEFTTYIATTKKELIWFFDEYVDFKGKDKKRAREAYNTFLDAWEDGMIFECAF